MSYSPMADDLLSLMPLVVTLTPYTITGNGQHIPGTAHSYHAYISSDSKAIFNATGQVVFSSSVVYIHPRALDGTILTSITTDAILQLPDGTKPRIVQIGALQDDVGITAWEIRS